MRATGKRRFEDSMVIHNNEDPNQKKIIIGVDAEVRTLVSQAAYLLNENYRENMIPANALFMRAKQLNPDHPLVCEIDEQLINGTFVASVFIEKHALKV